MSRPMWIHETATIVSLQPLSGVSASCAAKPAFVVLEEQDGRSFALSSLLHCFQCSAESIKQLRAVG
jgi:cytochrome c-type biogenesis protein CcmH/NrfF